jgi:hypothetical protein
MSEFTPIVATEFQLGDKVVFIPYDMPGEVKRISTMPPYRYDLRMVNGIEIRSVPAEDLRLEEES